MAKLEPQPPLEVVIPALYELRIDGKRDLGLHGILHGTVDQLCPYAQGEGEILEAHGLGDGVGQVHRLVVHEAFEEQPIRRPFSDRKPPRLGLSTS
ncbi:hypothetical protein ACWEO2_12410 [Nocardia sp. NPDC004278]